MTGRHSVSALHSQRRAQSMLDTLSALQQPNPFEMPPDQELFDLREKEVQIAKKRLLSLAQKSLAERTIDSLPPLHTQKSRGKITRETSTDWQIAPPVAEHQQRQQISEFVNQKREVFLVQLLIDRKNKEIERIQNTRKTEKKNINEEYQKIAETSNQYKMTTNQYEAELTRGKKTMDAAVRKRTELSKELKTKNALISVLERDISCNEETLYAFRMYADFMRKLTPHGKVMKDFFKEPQTLLDEMEKVENENLFLIAYCHDFMNGQESGLKIVQSELDRTEQESNVVDQAMQNLQNVAEIAESAVQESEQLDGQRRRLANLVARTYKHCFGESSEINTLVRLERIENELEKMYQESATIDPSFMAAKQAEKDKARRDIQRREKAEKQEREQKRKLEQALARAQEPVKRRTGRPVFERLLPLKKAQSTVDEKKKQEEELQQDAFLFGPIGD